MDVSHRKLNWVARRSLLILFFATALSACSSQVEATSDKSNHEFFFEVKEIQALDAVHLWQLDSIQESLSKENFMVNYWGFNPIFFQNYGDRTIPVAIILVGDNRVNSIPTAYFVSAKARASLVLASNKISDDQINKVGFMFEFRQTNCDDCEKGRMLFIEQNGNLILKTENIADDINNK